MDALLVFYDYEGTLATSIRRHYVQYVEALRRIRERLGLQTMCELQPIDEATFLSTFPKVKKVSNLLPFASSKSGEAVIAKELVQRQFSEIIWEYKPEHLLLEEVLPGNLSALNELRAYTSPVVVSYTRQKQAEFRAHLVRIGISQSGRIPEERVFIVGADGKKSRQAKADCIRERYADAIAAQRRAGLNPLMVADSVEDMAAAFDCGLSFVGVYARGNSSEEEFLNVWQQEKVLREEQGITARFFPALSSPECVQHILRCAQQG